MRKIICFLGILILPFLLIGCGKKEPELTFEDYYDYKVTQTLNALSETYQYNYVYDYKIQIKPNKDYSNHPEYILKFQIFDGDADDPFAEEILIKYYTVNENINIDETIINVYVDNFTLSPYKVQSVATKGQDYIKDFALDKVVIKFDSNGGSTIANQEVPRGQKATKPENPEKDNAKFLYWSTSILNPSEFTFENTMNQDITLYAIYEEYTVITFDYNDETKPTYNTTLAIGSKISGLPTPSKTGYSFSGWYKDSNLKTKVINGVTIVEKDMKLYAKWTPLEYNITYMISADVTNPNTVKEYNIESSMFHLNEPTRLGYIFKGWYSNKDFNGDAIAEIKQGSYGNIYLYPKWEGNFYTVELVFNDENRQSETITAQYGENYPNLPIPSKEGYIFEGWYKKEQDYGTLVSLNVGDNNFYRDSIVDTANNHNLYAKWIKGTEGLEFKYENSSWNITGYTGDSLIIIIPETLSAIPVTSIQSYAFSGLNFIKEVVIPDSVKSIGSYIFYNVSSLEKISLPFLNIINLNGQDYTILGLLFGSNTTIPTDLGLYYSTSFNYNNFTFYVPNSLKEVYITNATQIGNHAFYGAKSIAVLKVNEGITVIGESAFEGMTSLVELVIPSTVTIIERNAFNNCSSLASINISSSVSSIGEYAFYFCSKLTIYAEASSKPNGWNSNWNVSNQPVIWGYTK